MNKTVVVGVDGSPTARKAAEAARDLAAALGATLHVVSAFDTDRSEVFGSGTNNDHVMQNVLLLEIQFSDVQTVS